jgi:hypothetical protein
MLARVKYSYWLASGFKLSEQEQQRANANARNGKGAKVSQAEAVPALGFPLTEP